MLIAIKSMEDIECLKAQLADKFDMKDIGHTRRILDIESHRDWTAGQLWLS